MFQVKKILFPVDLTENTRRIFPFVLGMVHQCQAELHLLHVTLDMEQFGGLYDLTALQTDFQGAAKTKLEDLCQCELAELPGVIIKVDNGDPAHKIVEYAAREGVDLVIMGTHGRKGLEHVICGSVAENVVRHSEVPVLTVNPHRVKG
jgi:nucleotide-binding universal stress UspA family protein